MERLRTLFISLYLPCVILLGLWALWRALLPLALTPRLDWYGAVLACLTLPVWLMRLHLRQPARAPAHLPAVTGLVWTGACVAVFGTLLNDNPDWRPLACVAFALTGYLLFLLWYSWRPEAVLPIQPGMAVPPLSLHTSEGPMPEAAQLGAPALWLFCRGKASPLCRGQLAELLTLQPMLSARSAHLIVVSPEPLAGVVTGPEVSLCHDPALTAAAQLGLLRRGAVPFWGRLAGRGADTLQPALILTDSDGDLIRLDISDNEWTRPAPGALIRMLERNNGRS